MYDFSWQPIFTYTCFITNEMNAEWGNKMNAEWGNKPCLYQHDSATKMDFSKNDLGG